MATLVHLGGYLLSAACLAMMLGCVGGAARLLRRLHRRSADEVASTSSAVVFADLDGYTALAEREGDGRAAEVAGALARHARAACVGDARLVKTSGDGVMITASSVEDGLLTATRLNRKVTADPGLPAIATGISYGPCVRKGGDVFGASVNLAARLADVAAPGEIWCPPLVADVAAEMGLTREQVGVVTLDGVGEPVTVHRVAIADGAPQPPRPSWETAELQPA